MNTEAQNTTMMAANPRGILCTPASAAAASSGMSGHSLLSSSHHSISHNSAHVAPRAHTHTPLQQPDYVAPLRVANTGTANTCTSSGLRSRIRSRSPGALVGGGFDNSSGAIINGRREGSESVAIDFSDSFSTRMRHWKKMSSMSDVLANDVRADDATKAQSATRPTTISATKRRSGGDRLPLYHPNQRMAYQQAYTNSPYHAHAHHQGPASWFTHSAFLLVILYVMLDSKAKVDRSTAQLRYYREEESRVNAKISEFEERSKQLSMETERRRRDNEALEERKAEQLAKLDDEDGMDSIIRNQMQNLHERIQIESRLEVEEKFGAERQIVEVDLIFPEGAPTHDEETGRALSTKFHIEMASLADMPHTVQLFLEQVHHGLWDGCAFVWNPDHLVLAR